ncbi:unnamed protein product [Nippostrongylus brasiliensis]|uniref:F-box domain-containing protein n=1 Tax=Nippostrongylus brasiliensis TaxID=27835 RepID=A0A0N4YFQ3_NIPBR|nr:unnamed protein product [Nippostrongylus brasiliensis]
MPTSSDEGHDCCQQPSQSTVSVFVCVVVDPVSICERVWNPYPSDRFLAVFPTPDRPEPFPWNRLPRELQVKILTSLSRRDLARCRLLNRETFEIIRASEGSMKRRHLELVRIERVGGGRVQLSVRCDEEETTRKWVACQKRKRRSVGGLSTDIKVNSDSDACYLTHMGNLNGTCHA